MQRNISTSVIPRIFQWKILRESSVDRPRIAQAIRAMTMPALLSSTLVLSACSNMIDKLSQVGQRPPLSEVSNPQNAPDYKPISWPLPDPQPTSSRTANSLWQPGSRAFFRDQRASRVGDILRINVAISDQAKIDNTNNVKRDSSDNSATDVFGLERRLSHYTDYPAPGGPGPKIGYSTDTQHTSTGTVDRRETIKTQVAAMITQVLPNGNLAIDGSQEILINQEVREISVKGVVRPQDINTDNTIESSQVAQARIVYSGRGQLTDVEKPRWGAQILDVVSPF